MFVVKYKKTDKKKGMTPKMKKIYLEKAGLTVSSICLGTMMYGTQLPEREAVAQLDLFTEMGGNFIDTSNNYAHWWKGASGDESECLLGRWIADKKNRDDLVIATKVGFDRHGVGAGLRPEQIEYWCDESLRKLGIDYIDLYYAHVDDMSLPTEVYMEAFDRLVKKWKVRALGISNCYTWRMCEAKHAAMAHGYTDFSVNQACYTYLDAKNGYPNPLYLNLNVTDERLAYLRANNIPLVAYSCLASGGYDNPDRLPPKYPRGEKLDFLRECARELGISASELVIAWLIGSSELEGRPTVIPLFSSTNIEHLEKNLKMSDYNLDHDLLVKLTNAKFF